MLSQSRADHCLPPLSSFPSTLSSTLLTDSIPSLHAKKEGRKERERITVMGESKQSCSVHAAHAADPEELQYGHAKLLLDRRAAYIWQSACLSVGRACIKHYHENSADTARRATPTRKKKTKETFLSCQDFAQTSAIPILTRITKKGGTEWRRRNGGFRVGASLKGWDGSLQCSEVENSNKRNKDSGHMRSTNLRSLTWR